MSETTVTVEVEMSLEDAFFEETTVWEEGAEIEVCDEWDNKRVLVRPESDTDYWLSDEFEDLGPWEIVDVFGSDNGPAITFERNENNGIGITFDKADPIHL